jgi:hypothetical protein
MRYQVKLFKDLLSSDGHPFHCLQSIIDVEAESPDRAVQLVLHDMRRSASDWDISVAALEDGAAQWNSSRIRPAS